MRSPSRLSPASRPAAAAAAARDQGIVAGRLIGRGSYNGRFGGMDLDDFGHAIYAGTEPMPEPWRSWVRKTGSDYLSMIYQGCVEDTSWPDRLLAELQDMLL